MAQKPGILSGDRVLSGRSIWHNLSLKPEIFYPNASPLLFQQTLSIGQRNQVASDGP
ncbi:hypothetical protein [Microcystis aeruginosa]|uniref:Uncharacterized protein n=1 Tax=Microcystis aeruginosa (strain NIES-843 / IAM M-2473) TaxID=449447 RepID=B0JW67_MICAN|nr:hypothetical protein [Microcystis aeruginosa]BAG01547.1 unknown protein [Microcystis aeruginosa NIES-843]